MVTALKPTQSKKLQDLLTERGAAKRVLDFMLKVIERNKSIPSDGAAFQLTALFDAIRAERNSAFIRIQRKSPEILFAFSQQRSHTHEQERELRSWLKLTR